MTLCNGWWWHCVMDDGWHYVLIAPDFSVFPQQQQQQAATTTSIKSYPCYCNQPLMILLCFETGRGRIKKQALVAFWLTHWLLWCACGCFRVFIFSRRFDWLIDWLIDWRRFYGVHIAANDYLLSSRLIFSVSFWWWWWCADVVNACLYCTYSSSSFYRIIYLIS